MAKLARKMVLNRDYTLDSIYGHSIKFLKGVPALVTPMLHSAALAIGADFVDGADAVVEDDAGPVEPMDPGERAELLMKIMYKLYDKNDRDDFTGAGAPSVPAVSREFGWKITSNELKIALQAYHDEVAAKKHG